MLENMILGVGRYQDYDDCLPECKAITERLSEMIHEILETSKLSVSTKNAVPIKINVSELLASLCEPYQLIATTHGVQFHLKIDDAVSVELPIHEFSKALSNILGNAVAYTPNGKCVSVYLRAHMIVVENERRFPLNSQVGTEFNGGQAMEKDLILIGKMAEMALACILSLQFFRR